MKGISTIRQRIYSERDSNIDLELELLIDLLET